MKGNPITSVAIQGGIGLGNIHESNLPAIYIMFLFASGFVGMTKPMMGKVGEVWYFPQTSKDSLRESPGAYPVAVVGFVEDSMRRAMRDQVLDVTVNTLYAMLEHFLWDFIMPFICQNAHACHHSNLDALNSNCLGALE